MTPAAALAVDLTLEVAGAAAAVCYIIYGLFFLALGTGLLLHHLVLAYTLMALWRYRQPGVILVAEAIYGLVNPLIYLIIFERSSLVARHWLLTGCAWTLLTAVWAARFTLGLPRFRESRAARGYVVGLSIACLACLAAFFAKDLLYGLRGEHYNGAWTRSPQQDLFLAPLYAIPAALVLHHLRAARSADAWHAGRRFFLTAPRLGWVAAALVGITVMLGAYRPFEFQVQRMVLQQRSAILSAARHHAVDPALIASILYVTHQDLATPFARRLERLAMAAWRVDAHGNFFLIRPLDVSVGVAQIKPRTAMAALMIRAAADGLYDDDLVWPRVSRAVLPLNSKDYRELPRLGSRWRLPVAAIASLDSPFTGPLPKSEVVRQLFDDRLNVEMCALILALYAAQWEAADPHWSIRHRPEILATLYQIGFERSWPKPEPRPNRFGRQVAEVYRSRFIQGLFGPVAGQA